MTKSISIKLKWSEPASTLWVFFLMEYNAVVPSHEAITCGEGSVSVEGLCKCFPESCYLRKNSEPAWINNVLISLSSNTYSTVKKPYVISWKPVAYQECVDAHSKIIIFFPLHYCKYTMLKPPIVNENKIQRRQHESVRQVLSDAKTIIVMMLQWRASVERRVQIEANKLSWH